MALSRLRCWERSFWQETTIPVGKWVMRTAESVTFTCWPPFPLARNVSIRRSPSSTSISIRSSRSGKAATDANDVWRRCWVSKGDIRTSRWTPDSTRRRP